MSFILEALKKSDKKRQSEAVPKIQTEHEKPVASRRRSLRVTILMLFLLLNAAGLIWFLAPWRESENQAELIPAVEPVVEARAKSTPAGNTRQTRKEVTAAKVATESAQSTTTRPSTDNSPSASTGRIYQIEELPSSIRGRIPELHISLHAFSKEQAQGSMVRVNGQILREGSRLDGGFLLTKVTAEGAIFRYQGYRFLLPRKN